MARLLSMGAATLDTVFRLPELPAKGGKYLPTASYQFAAGMATSAAIAAAKLGGEVAMWACVGDDDTGARYVAELKAAGVDTRGVLRKPGVLTAFATNIVDDSGERIVVPFYDPRLREAPDWLDFEAVGVFDAVLADVRWPSAAAPALRAARRLGVPSVLDADVATRDILELLVPLAAYPVFSEPAALMLSGAADPLAALSILSRRYGFVAVTAGPDGCYWQDAAEAPVQHRAAPKIEAVDTLSAGDVFHGAFALAIAERRLVSEAVEFANIAAAIKCTRPGGRLGAPTRAEVEAFAG